MHVGAQAEQPALQPCDSVRAPQLKHHRVAWPLVCHGAGQARKAVDLGRRSALMRTRQAREQVQCVVQGRGAAPRIAQVQQA